MQAYIYELGVLHKVFPDLKDLLDAAAIVFLVCGPRKSGWWQTGRTSSEKSPSSHLL